MKRIIDAGVPIVFAGLPKVRTFLTSEHPDILSRLKILVLYPIVVEDFIAEYSDIKPEAVEQLYMAANGDMRKFKADHCRFVRNPQNRGSLRRPDSTNAGFFTPTDHRP